MEASKAGELTWQGHEVLKAMQLELTGIKPILKLGDRNSELSFLNTNKCVVKK